MNKIITLIIIYLCSAVLQWYANYIFIPMGLSLNVLIVFTLAIAASTNPVASIAFGFFSGLYLDFIGVHLFGLYALSHTVAAFLVFMLRADVNFSLPLVQIIFSAAAAVFCMLVYSILGLLIVGKFVFGTWADFIFNPLVAAIISLIIFPLVKRLLYEPTPGYMVTFRR